MSKKIKVLHRAEVINAISDIFYNGEAMIIVVAVVVIKAEEAAAVVAAVVVVAEAAILAVAVVVVIKVAKLAPIHHRSQVLLQGHLNHVQRVHLATNYYVML